MAMHCTSCPGRNFAICGPIPDLVGEGFEGIRLGTRSVPARHVVWQEEQDTGEFLTLSSGWAFSYRLTADGRRQILSLLLPGDAVGLRELFFAEGEPAVKTITDAEFCVFQREVLRAFARRYPVGTARAVRALAQTVRALERRFVGLGKLSASERIARLILDLHMRLHARGLTAGNWMPFPLSQEHIGDAVGLTSIHVHRVLKTLKDERIIRTEHRRLEIRDRRALMNAAAYRDADPDQFQAVEREMRFIDKAFAPRSRRVARRPPATTG